MSALSSPEPDAGFAHRRHPRGRGALGRWALASAIGLLLAVPLPMPRSASAGDERSSPTESASEGATSAASPGAEAPHAERVGKPKPPKKRRGGVNPCMTPDPGYGVYDKWSTAPSVGQMIMPHKGGIRKNGAFDVVIHFHGHEPIRKEFVKQADGIVLVGIDLGIGSGAYSNAFASPSTYTRLIASIEAAMAKHTGKKKAHVRKVALSSWSAGYGAIEMILRQTGGKNIDALILLDSLHTGYVDESQKSLKTSQIEPFVAFAKKAAAGSKYMFLSHSSIIPPGYASTTEVANYVIGKVRGKPKKAKRHDVLGLDMFQKFDKGKLHVRGYTGNDKPDHCAHIGLMADVVAKHLEPRWKPAKGKR